MLASSHEHDLFICYAWEDKAEVARPLSQALTTRGWRVWLDDAELKVGDSISQRINEALARSRFGVVVLSPAFFAKPWPQRELGALEARERQSGDRVILPVWHHINAAGIAAHWPALADRLGVKTEKGIDYVADQISRGLRESAEPGDPRWPGPHAPLVRSASDHPLPLIGPDVSTIFSNCPPAQALHLLTFGFVLRGFGSGLGPVVDLFRSGDPDIRLLIDLLHRVARRGRSDDDVLHSAAAVVDEWRALVRELILPDDLSSDDPTVELISSLIARDYPPVDVFSELFAFIDERAGSLYGEAWPNVKYRVMTLRFAGADRLGVRVATRWSTGAATVELIVNEATFGPEAFAMLPLFIAHECISHVIRATHRSPYSAHRSTFGGVMDWATNQYLDTWFAELPVVWRDKEMLLYARSTAADLSGQPPASRTMGRRICHRLVEALITAEGYSAASAEAAVAAFAIRLNTLDAPDTSKDELVERLPRLAESSARTLSAKVMDVVGNALDPAELLDEVTSLG